MKTLKKPFFFFLVLIAMLILYVLTFENDQFSLHDAKNILRGIEFLAKQTYEWLERKKLEKEKKQRRKKRK